MNRIDIQEFYFITPIANMPSIIQNGIVSNRLAARLPHNSVAMQEVQEKRENKQIPGARKLHEYANLYFDAHNPMLSKRRSQNDEICVLRIDPAVLDIKGAIIADRNAASGWAGFFPSPEGLARINNERVFAKYWTHPTDPYDAMSHKSEKCAELLVPDKVDARFVIGAYVANQAALSCFQKLNIGLPVAIKNDMFF